MHLRSCRAHPQGEPVRSAPQICRCHACRRGDRPSRRNPHGARRGVTETMKSAALVFKGLLCASVILMTLAPAQAQTDQPVSFAGKQIKISIGFSPTGFGYDTYGRLRSEEHTSELQSHSDLVCRLLLEKK